ncbi:MAG TPA: CPBP family intramembrane glutamic endopeptidase [Pirellulales bacterium]|nr:CPBP family intramembrane glutamic endopeptidase [Pirellulales bacterium]
MSVLMPFTVATLVAANLWLWFLLVGRWRQGRALVPLEPRRPVPWTGLDVAAVALGYFLVSNIVVALMPAAGQPMVASGEADAATDTTRTPARLMGIAAVNLATLAAAIFWIRRRRRAEWADLGFDRSRLSADVRLGLAAFAVVSVPIYAMQAGLTQLTTPSEHPIVKAWQATSEPGWGLRLSSLFSAVLVAPLAEEFLFRVVLQGWLESLENDSWMQANGPSIAGAAIRSTPTRRRWSPVVLSSAIFALIHLPHGVVPLFFFALALGYLYQQTHRLWPSMVVHLCLNACTMAMLWMGPR